jgi:hypothetical protein
MSLIPEGGSATTFVASSFATFDIEKESGGGKTKVMTLVFALV